MRIVAGMSTIDVPEQRGATGSLQLSDQFVAPIGSFTLAGVGTESPRRGARSCPRACGPEVTGAYDPDGRHVSFTPPAT
jgi:hypothetical protein